MRILMDITFPHETFNAAVRDGTVGGKLNRILEDTKPDAVYFVERNGKRGASIVVNITDSSEMPKLAEPWFLNFNADVQFHGAMTPEDLQKAGLDEIAKKWA